MNIHKQQLEQIRKDSRYRENIEWGSPRPGHPEGTVQKHILELESNLNALEPETTSLERDKLKLLIHVHDSFKKDAKRGVAIPTATRPWLEAFWQATAPTRIS